MKSVRVILLASALLAALPSGAVPQQRVEIDSTGSNSVTAVAFSPDGRFPASANANGTVKVWNLLTGRRNRTLRGHAGAINSVSLLLEGLSGKADGGSAPDGKITVKELEAFLSDMVPEITRQHRGAPQFPNSNSRGQDFPLAIK